MSVLKLDFSQARSERLLVAAGAVVSFIVIASIALFIVANRESELKDSARELGQLALALSQATERGFESAEVIQNSMIDRMRTAGVTSSADLARLMKTSEIHDLMKEKISNVPIVDALAIVDANGKLVNYSRSWPIPDVTINDREYFKIFVGNRGLDTFIGEPVRNRGNGVWTIYLAKRINGPDGGFVGLVLAAMKVSYFESVFSSFGMPGGYITLLHPNGAPLARYPHVDEEFNQSHANLPIFEGNRGLAKTGTFIGDRAGTRRMLAFSAMQNFSTIVTVSKSLAAILADWWRLSQILCAAAVVIVSLIATTVAGLLRAMGQQRLSAEADKARLATELELATQQAISQQAGHFEVALNHMLHGMSMFDADGNLIVCNRRYAELYALPPDLMRRGTSWRAISAHLTATFGCRAIDWKKAIADHNALTAADSELTYMRDLNNGRIIFIRYRMTEDGGRVAVHEDITERRKTEARLTHMARHDTLTGLPNRYVFQEHMDKSLARTGLGEAFAVLCIDLDHFKDINDLLGHAIGDMLLREVAARLSSVVDAADTVARIGGDEFAIVQSSISKPCDPGRLASRIVERLCEPFEIDGHKIDIGASVGIACAPRDDQDGPRLLSKADIALYHAKSAGRRGFRFFESDMDAALQARRNLELDLRQALQKEEFELYFQPLVDARTREITSFEALLRWNHPSLGLVMPADFIALAEETGIIVPLGEWVVRAACREATTWPDTIRVSVNVSAIQFRPGTLVGIVGAILDETGLAPGRLELEITESVLLHEESAHLAVLHQLRGLGAKIVMDDFGTGYSSLNYLRVFPFDKIKIDRSFIQNLDQPSANAIVCAVAQLGKMLGIRMTAEGIETEVQLAEIVELGFAEGQGYLFSRPVPAGAAQAMLRDRAARPEAA
ncbi:MAG: EAL domain-containing protein [Beijerinckiaceae bacterium]|nr:EAL domain-containing protein [Beijerinckiaceae bacterium]